MTLPAEDLYRKAALTGEAVTGTIHDQQGERMVCVTPVGGLSGETVESAGDRSLYIQYRRIYSDSM